jgi:hypothetical protein
MLGEKEWHGLQAALEQMRTDYQRFLELSKKQKTVLIQHDASALQEVMAALEQTADSIYLMDARRRMHMEILADMQGKEVLRLLDLVALWPELDATPFATLVKDLQTLRTDIEAITRINSALIQSSRQFLQATVEAVVLAPGEKKNVQATRTYGADGQLRKARTQVPRNLINRRG